MTVIYLHFSGHMELLAGRYSVWGQLLILEWKTVKYWNCCVKV